MFNKMMTKWEAFAKSYYEKRGKHFQSRYDKWRNLKSPKWYVDITDLAWAKLDDTAKAYLNKLALETIKTFGDEFAKKVIKFILELQNYKFIEPDTTT